MFERFHSSRAIGRGVRDDDVDCQIVDRGLELRPTGDGSESMLRTEDDSEVAEKLTREVRDDVHAVAVEGSVTQNAEIMTQNASLRPEPRP